MKRVRIVLAGVVLCASACAVRADCIDDAARFHHLNARLVRAIATVESGQHPDAVHVNADGTSDIGLMQINSRWLSTLSRFGISRAGLYDSCTNAYVGAWILSQNIHRLGLTWDAIGAYNAATQTRRVAYARRVYRQIFAAPVSAQPDAAYRASPAPGFVAKLFQPVAWGNGR
ncbi:MULTISPECIES: lytic transglycosylase domain-containing protein [Paraburkholderia]|uniref:lytic transglycosylase domain-containing protein n=1 Tax=Paraburkholderia sp. USG1 TaxID=2952268 RepID=UPI0028700B28|nr:lytic transglycosylase domain-containing protein [Paraburkholderia sp. USG1]